jgi:hypothetical protein
MAEWQLIDTAPHDPDLQVIVCVPVPQNGRQIVGEAYWCGNGDPNDEGWWWAQTSPGDYRCDSIVNALGAEPTHWMPMPEPPWTT